VHLFYVSFSMCLANDLKISSPMSHCFLKAVFMRIRKISNSNYWLRHVCRLSVRSSAWHNSALSTRIFWFRFNMTRITGTFHEDQCKFTAVSCGILLRVRNVSKAVQKIKTHMLCSITFFFLNSRSWWDNVKKCGTARQATDESIIWRMRVACWITMATDTLS
jgi:hypothetical protein